MLTLRQLKERVDRAIADGVDPDTVVVASLHDDSSEIMQVDDAWFNSAEDNLDWHESFADDVGIEWDAEAVRPTFVIGATGSFRFIDEEKSR